MYDAQLKDLNQQLRIAQGQSVNPDSEKNLEIIKEMSAKITELQTENEQLKNSQNSVVEQLNQKILKLEKNISQSEVQELKEDNEM